MPLAPRTLRASSLAEVAWASPDGPAVRGVVALAVDDQPVLALTYADEALARSLAAAPEVALSLSEPRGTGPGFVPALVRAVPRLVEDPRAERFSLALLDEELRRFPPARVLADSAMLRREHWWYLPRLLVHLDVTGTEPLPAREDPGHQLLVTEPEPGRPLAVHVVSAPGLADALAGRTPPGPGGGLALGPVGGTPAPPPSDRALLFGQDASFPDLERWSQWSFHGRWDGQALQVRQAPSAVGLEPRPSLVRRWRRQRALERRCRAALARHPT